MKYVLFLLCLHLVLSACESDKPKTVETKQYLTPPQSTNRGVPAPEPSGVDSIRQNERKADSLGQGANPSPLKNNKSHATRSVDAAPKPGSKTPGTRGAAASNGFVDIQDLDPTIQVDIRYATTNNFTESKIYDCARCLLRPETAQALLRAQNTLQSQGLRLKVYDCYRPRPFQQRLWDKVPNPDYVTPPQKGSMHSRGAAVDLTIVDAQGKELDMGTAYDFFGPEAHFDYNRLSSTVLSNRRLLRRVMEEVGLKGIRTEWWHFSYSRKSYALSDWVWECGSN